jgi:hypothetical protein
MDIELLDSPSLQVPSAGAENASVGAVHTGLPPVAPALQVPAWLLEFDWQKYVALPVHTAIEVLEEPDIVCVPGAAYYGRGMLRWQGRYLAVLDLCALINAHPKAGAPPTRHALVVAYQAVPRGPIDYGAIATVGLPQNVQVRDDMQRPLPTDSDLWPLVAVSCFAWGAAVVPHLDPRRVFTGRWG